MNTTGSAPTDIPPIARSVVNRQVRLVARPEGIPQAEHFRIVEDAVPEPGPGQFRVRNIYLSVDPAQRGWASSEANYAHPVEIGAPMRALAVGVVDASRCDGVSEGEFLYGWFGWQDYVVVDPSAIWLRANLALPLAQFGGLVGINGLTGYLGLTRCGRPTAGDTLLVSTAAGGVGSIVGQVGHILGCRTLGLTGSDEKVALCLNEFGYDMAWNYRTSDLREMLSKATPGGVDIYYDNVGGTILDTCLRHVAVRGRIVQCGTASIASWTPAPVGPRPEREILTRRLRWEGFVVSDCVSDFPEAAATLAAWYADGAIGMRLEIRDGIEYAAGSIADLYAGRNTGKRLIQIV